jgi:hypothetical protein
VELPEQPVVTFVPLAVHHVPVARPAPGTSVP